MFLYSYKIDDDGNYYDVSKNVCNYEGWLNKIKEVKNKGITTFYKNGKERSNTNINFYQDVQFADLSTGLIYHFMDNDFDIEYYAREIDPFLKN